MKTISSLIVMALFTTNFAIAMESTNKLFENFKLDPQRSCHVSWLPSHIVLSQDLTAQSIYRWCDNEEQAKSIFGSQVKVDEVGSFYGTNSPNIDVVRETALIDIRNEFEKSEARPRVLEIGPGHGFFSERMIIAGAHLTMVEHQKAALTVAVENIQKFMPPFLKEGEKIDDTFKAIHGDISAEGIIADEELFQFIVVIDVMHFLTPEQFQSMLAVVLSKLAPGGKLYMSGPSPSSVMQWVAYKKAEKNKSKFPGYMIFNTRDKSPVTLPNSDTMKPGIVYGGRFYGDPEYEVRNFFSPSTLRDRLSELGLTVIEVFFRDADNQKILPDGKIDYTFMYTVSAIAQKS